MKEKEFAENWSLNSEMEEHILADLRSVMREKLIEYDKWVLKASGRSDMIITSDVMVDEFLNQTLGS